MADEGKLKAKLGLDTKEFEKRLKDAYNATKNFSSKLSGVSKTITAIFTSGAVGMAAMTIKKIFDTTQLAGDELANTISGIKSVALTTAQSLATMDFSVSLKDAYLAAKEYSAILDDLGDRQRSINYLSKEYQLQIAEARGILRRVKLTTDERAAAEEKIRKAVEGELALHKQLAEEGIGAELGFLQKKYNISKEDAKLVQDYVLNYAKIPKEQHDILSNLTKLYSEQKLNVNPIKFQEYYANLINEEIAKLPAEMRKYAAVWRPINDLTDKHRDKIVAYSQAYLDAQIALQNQLNLADRYGDMLDAIENKTENVAKATSEIPSLPLAPPMVVSGVGAPSFAPALNLDLRPMRENARMFIDFWSEAAQTFGGITMTMANSFANVGSVINNVMADSEVNFSEAMGVISESAFALIPVLETLAAAHIFAGEGWKGVAGVLAAIGGITMMLATMASLGKKRKMAEGGIVYGPTSAIVGEYASARTNPEVVAPLDRLQRLVGGKQTIEVVGKIKGTDIVLAMERNMGINYRTI